LRECADGKAIDPAYLEKTLVYINGYTKNYPKILLKTRRYLGLATYPEEVLQLVGNAVGSIRASQRQGEAATETTYTLGRRVMKLLFRRARRGLHDEYSLRPRRQR
jgi:hypothetical protein